MPEEKYESAKELVDALRPSHSRWRRATVGGAADRWLFRGHGNAEWDLTPTLFRDWGQIPSAMSGKYEKWRAVAYHEVTQVRSFLEIADGANLLSPSSGQILDAVNKRVGSLFLDNPDQSMSNFMSSSQVKGAFGLAQHHGIQTRLLDWTGNPLVAAYFAAFDCHNASDEREHFCVWASQQSRTNYDEGLRFFGTPDFGNDYLRAQRGFFSIDIKADQHFDANGEWKPQQDLLKEYDELRGDDAEPTFYKLIAPSDAAKELLQILRHEFISPVSIMPTLDNAAKTVSYINGLYFEESGLDQFLRPLSD